MIGFLRGKLCQVVPEGVLLETGGIGWLIRTPSNYAWPDPGTEITIYTHLVVKEDALELYGFLQQDSLKLFTLLLGVSGVGPRGAIQILSSADPQQLCQAITNEDVSFLTALPGIGVKKAKRLLLELKDTLAKSGLPVKSVANAGTTGSEESGNDEVLLALLSLGYSKEEIGPVVYTVRSELGPGATTENVLQAVLKVLGQGEGIN
ncbi:MAG: holliday junction helicase RuvA [Clostridia bacterium]|nr:holliday junction helicase RuvA [Clostridia bacterium]